jgi:transcriptional regulator with XRE-family HTH domain
MIGVRIKSLREEHGMTQTELGNLLGVVKQTVSSWENEISSPGNDTLLKMADIFEVSADFLLGKSDDVNSVEQSEPEYTTEKERQLLSLYREYLDNGYSYEIRERLISFMPELADTYGSKSYAERKILKTFSSLNEDNQDIIIGKAKELLREQVTFPPVAAAGVCNISGK